MSKVSRNDVLSFIKIAASDIVNDNIEITEESDFHNDLGCDSLDVADIVMKTEHEFTVSLSDDKLEKMETVKELIDIVLEGRENGI
jgi:acyl carrier protein